ncbi:hypothetical protein UF75_1094 [Desulfosporosinus sp. I2]|nr:hypothetical protein [Desulfosporosinus sp. I2]KJR48566.1 hypothetical protein UF75_1094 [Desulfosporosinus sp. I2]
MSRGFTLKDITKDITRPENLINIMLFMVDYGEADLKGLELMLGEFS